MRLSPLLSVGMLVAGTLCRAQASAGTVGWAQPGKGRFAFVADSTECRATGARMGDDTMAQLETCLQARFGWQRATLFVVPAGCRAVEVRVVSTPRDAKEAALLNGVADSIASRLQRNWSITADEHADTVRMTWSVDRSGLVAGIRRLGTSPASGREFARLERLIERVGTMPIPIRFREQDWNPFQLAAQFSGPCVTDATPTTQEDASRPYFEFQVEKQATTVPGSPLPRYPEMLRSANVEGEVLAQFVVDTTGRADMSTFKVLKSSHELFTQAVRDVLPYMRFYPAEIGGRKVKQLTQQPFPFIL